jgi:hypothetical protein
VDLQVSQESAGQPLVYQDASMLRIIRELDNVERSIFGFHKMGLRPASHFSDQRACAEGHSLEAMAKSLEKESSRKESNSRMAEELDTQEKKQPTNQDEVALELMKFIAVSTGYGKGSGAAGFGGKPTRSNEEYADSLLELFERCRSVVRKQPS